jgi:hypothetical protein
MTIPSEILITSENYFSCKSDMEDLLQSRGHYWVILGIKISPLQPLKRAKWIKKNEKAHGFVGMSIFSDLQFHLQGIKTSHVVQ